MWRVLVVLVFVSVAGCGASSNDWRRARYDYARLNYCPESAVTVAPSSEHPSAVQARNRPPLDSAVLEDPSRRALYEQQRARDAAVVDGLDTTFEVDGCAGRQVWICSPGPRHASCLRYDFPDATSGGA